MFIRCRFCSELFRDEESFEKHKCPKNKQLAYEEGRTDKWERELKEGWTKPKVKPKPEKKTGTLEDYLDET